MTTNKVMTCVKLTAETADRLTEVARCLSITGQTKTSIIETALRQFFKQLYQDPNYQELRKRVEKMRNGSFGIEREAIAPPHRR